MSKPRPRWDQQASQPVVTRVTRSSSTKASETQLLQPQASGPSPDRVQPRKQTDSVLAQGLSQMTMSGQEAHPARKGRPFKTSSSNSGSPPAQGGVSLGSKQRPRGSREGLASVARLVKLGRCKNVVVVAGAGISTPSGIPDFRTPGTGLYSNLKKYSIPYPEAIFNIDYFSEDPRPFFSLAKELYPGFHRPNYIHYFIRVLHHKGILLRMYTQNIDGLETVCGIPDDKLVEAHGSFATASCHLCYTPFPAEDAKSTIMSDQVPICTFCAGTVKPDVVFFGEDLPQKYFQHAADFPKADLLIVMGTSLQIEPFASLVNTVRPGVPRLLLNRDAVGPFLKTPLRRGDHVQLGDLADTVRTLADMLGWHSDVARLMRAQEDGAVSAMMVSSLSGDQRRASGLGRRGAPEPWGRRPPKSRPGVPASPSCSSEEGDSDSKSTVSSSPSN
ncbi:NAD-dependent protein deacetylase sirtuin-3 isoform X1 [Osmerus eperlanus]|uniref:NAD-dependent protein deacetylase sirtuin-3 isoform X1 n=1 Tax=Osmerus eperlanus TaxID=29151 RepID=UPI002E1455D6